MNTSCETKPSTPNPKFQTRNSEPQERLNLNPQLQTPNPFQGGAAGAGGRRFAARRGSHVPRGSGRVLRPPVESHFARLFTFRPFIRICTPVYSFALSPFRGAKRQLRPARQVLPRRIYRLDGFRKSTPPRNRQLIFY